MIVTDSDYLEQLEIIRGIRDTITTNDEINLPQICVIGDQSSGKSSFLSRLTGVSFPTAAKMCTKAATVVTCNRDETLANAKYEIEVWNNRGTYVEVASTAEAIKETQDKLLTADGASSDDDNRIIADNSIKLRVTGPHVIDIIIVDLPGIQHAGPTKDAINALIEKNIEKPETLNLLVSEAKQDAELTKAIEIAEKYDPTNERTIRVLSKFDNFDTPETRERAIRLVKDGLTFDGSNTEAPHQLNLGPQAVISLGSDGKLRTDEDGDTEERKQLVDEFGLPESRSGIVTLKERLQPLFANLIKSNLPLLKQNVSDRLNETQILLEKVGKVPLSSLEILFKCHACLLDNVDTFEVDLTRESFLPMKTDVLAVREKITFEFATAGFELNSFDCILFQGKTAFDEVAQQIRTLWEPIVHEYVKSTKQLASESVHRLRNESNTKMYPLLISAIHAEYQDHLQINVLPAFHEACMKCLHEEGFFGTNNHYFDAKFLEDEMCPQALIDLFSQKAEQVLKDDAKCTPHSSHSSYRIVKAYHFRQCLEEAKKEIAAESVHTDLMENQKQRLFSAVKAHFDVEKKTFVDNLLKKTKDILIKGHRDWIERNLLRSKKISDAATENESVKKLREDLLGKIARLQECMVLLRDVPLPVKSSGAGENITCGSRKE